MLNNHKMTATQNKQQREQVLPLGLAMGSDGEVVATNKSIGTKFNKCQKHMDDSAAAAGAEYLAAYLVSYFYR